MANLKLTFSLPNYDKATLTRDYQLTSRHQALSVLLNLVQKIVSGLAHGSGNTVSVQVSEQGIRASGTVTCGTVANASTVTIGNVVLTGETGTPSGQSQWKCGVSATADGAALAACINAHTTLSTWVSASAASGVVTITALDYDTRGNAYQLSSSDGTNLAVVGFASGAIDSGLKTYSL